MSLFFFIGTGAPTEVAYNINTAAIDHNNANDAAAGIAFQIDGTVDDKESTVAGSYAPRFASTDWVIPHATVDTVDHWIRATLDSGDSPTISAGFGTWLALSGAGEAERLWEYQVSDTSILSGTITFEIATDSGGSTIVATGQIFLRADGSV